MSRDGRMAEWNALVTEWLRLVEPQLVDHALSLAQGERGVMLMTVSRKHLNAAIATKKLPAGTTTRFEMADTTWVPFETFLGSIQEHHSDPTAAGRYRPML